MRTIELLATDVPSAGSRSVVLDAIAVMGDFPITNPIHVLLIAVSIMVRSGIVKSISACLMDAIDPAPMGEVELPLEHTTRVEAVRHTRIRRVGYRLVGFAAVKVATLSLHDTAHIAEHATEHGHEAKGNIDLFTDTPSVHAHKH